MNADGASDDNLREWLMAAGLRGRALESTLDKCESGDIYTVSDLQDLKEMPEQFSSLFPSGLSRGKIERALDSKDSVKPKISNGTASAQPEKIGSAQKLPKGKRYPFFASHKKSHTCFGDASADLARATKDIIKYKANLEGYFDADNLQNVSKQALSQGIVQSCSVLLFLNDETLDSKWVVHEVEEARSRRIPIICVVDLDRQTQREVIDHYLEKDFGWLFDAQVISFTTQNRDACIDLMISAIRRAIEYCHTHNTLTATTKVKGKKAKETHEQTRDLHESDAGNSPGLDSQLKKAVLAAFGSARAAFDTHSKHGLVGKKEWKKLIKKALPSLKSESSKLLRKRLPTRMSWAEFSAFFGGPGEAATSIYSDKGKATSKKADAAASLGTAALPPEVPELPPSFRPRIDAQERLLAALLAREGSRSTAVTAPKSRISSQGMGGVGKTMLTAAVVRDERLRAGFKTICWLNLSQQPEIMKLQAQLYSQLHEENDEMPTKAQKNADNQLRELRKLAANRLVLVVLDDMWDAEHERPFSCIDPDTASKLLCTTRIKGIMPKGTEIELELLGMKESVELLAAVAEIDADLTPPCCLEIARLCGRLPLCLNIVGNLIRTYGGGWEEEIPLILKKDMKSLTTDKGDSSQPLNLQKRVIQSGLDALEGEDAADIALLFKGMAVFAEDQVIPVAILSVLWVSIDPEEHKPLSGLKVRQWASQLLSRSILLGSSTDGVSMHDIVRDFTLASQPDSGLEQLQRSFIATLVPGVSSNFPGNAAEAAVSSYASSNLAHHLRSMLSPPFADDDLALVLLLHEVPSVVAQALASVNRSDVDTLADHFVETKECWSATRVFYALSFTATGLTEDERKSYMLKTLFASRNVDKQTQPGALTLEARCANMFMFAYPLHEETTRIADGLLAVAELEAKDINVEDMKALFTARTTVGTCLMGQFKLEHSFTVDTAQAQRGASMLLDSYAHKYRQARASLPEGSFEQLVTSACTQIPYTVYTLCFVQLQDVLEYTRAIPEGMGGLANQVNDMYQAERDMSRQMSRLGFDVVVGCGTCLVEAGTIAANMPLADAVLHKWVEGTLLAFRQKIFRYTVCHTFPLVHDLPKLQQALEACRMHWDVDATSPELVQMCIGRWRMEKDGEELVYNDPEKVVVLAKALMAARFPHCVEAQEVSGFLETVEAQKHDLFHQLGAMGATPNLLCSSCARLLSDSFLMERFAQSELAFTLNPVKQQRSHISLAVAHWSQKQEAEREQVE